MAYTRGSCDCSCHDGGYGARCGIVPCDCDDDVDREDDDVNGDSVLKALFPLPDKPKSGSEERSKEEAEDDRPKDESPQDDVAKHVNTSS